MTKQDFLFNFTFTRPDENDANIYRVGMHVEASNVAEAERLLMARNSHLTITAVDFFAVMDEDGKVLSKGDSDPRGPRRTITAVNPDPHGGLTKVTLSCGHVREFNQTMQYRTGEPARCFECRMV